MPTKYVSEDTAPMYIAATGTKKRLELLWGDQVNVLETGPLRSKVRGRGKNGFVSNAVLGDESLLEVYFIDVGQGDGVLIRTPEGRRGAHPRPSQCTDKRRKNIVCDIERKRPHMAGQNVYIEILTAPAWLASART